MNQVQMNLKRWRKIRGFTQEDLALKAGISRQGYMKLEKGATSPRTDTLLSIAKALEVSIPELIKEEPLWESLRYRTGKTNTQRILAEKRQMLIELHDWLEFYNDIESELEKCIDFKFKNYETAPPIEIAKRVREDFGVGESLPIPDLFELLEDAGIKLFLFDSEISNLFGMSVGIADGGPCIAVNTNNKSSVERQIFTAAHELGHLLLHKNSYLPSDNPITEEDNTEEHEANEFASYLLMPQEALIEEWNDNLGLNWIDRVLKVKKFFKVSYKTVLMRIAQEYNNPKEKQKFYMDFAIGYKSKYNHDLKSHVEPDALVEIREPQNTGLKDFDIREERFERLVREALEKELISISRAGEVLGLKPEEMRELVSSWDTEPAIFG